MKLLQILETDLDLILKTQWQLRQGKKVPGSEDIQLNNDAVQIDGTVLYADLAESTNLVQKFPAWFAATIYKSYLICACKIIRNNGGIITAFDGDRVMAVFIGEYKNTSAAKSALQINYIVNTVINKKIQKTYPNITYILHQAIGIDTSNLFIAKTGIRNNNDLVWVGRAANFAAKMCSLRQGNYTSYITKDVFDKLHNSLKYGGSQNQLMWEKIQWEPQKIDIYRSNWTYPT